MNIMIFSAIYPAPAEYGIPNDTKVVHYFAKQWKSMGHNVQVVYLHMNTVKKIISFTNLKKCLGYEADYVFEGINVHLLDYQMLVPKINYLLPFQAKNAEQRIKDFLKKSFVPDKVFVHFPCSFKGIDFLSGFDCPTMAVLHNCDMRILSNDVASQNEISLYKNVGGRNQNICEITSRLLSRKVQLVLSGIDESLVAQVDCVNQKASRLSKCLRIVYAGNLIKLKNVDVIIKALTEVEFDYQLDIIGDGPEKNKLMALAEKNSKIIFKGRQSREATIENMRDADVFVMVSSPETFGLVYLEAMAQGCLTIGSKNEGIDGVIANNKNGFLVNPGNIEELTECFNKISDMEIPKKREIIYSAYDTAKNMTDYKMALKYLQLNQ